MIGASVKDANAASGHHKIELVVVYIVSYVGRLDEQGLALLVERGASGVARAIMADAGEGDIEARAAGTSWVCARSRRKGVRDQWIVGIRRRRVVYACESSATRLARANTLALVRVERQCIAVNVAVTRGR